MIFSNCSSLRTFGPPRSICISRSMLFSLRDVRKGDTRRFMTEKPRSTTEVGGGISNTNLKSFNLKNHFYKHTVNLA